MPRFLICKGCNSLNTVPDVPDGTPPEYDFALEHVVQQHQHLDLPDSVREHMGTLLRCDPATWDKIEAAGGTMEIRKELLKNHVEIDALRDVLKEDALKCFSKHGRPKQGCIDYCSQEKSIGRTRHVPPDMRQYLCYHCPVHSGFVQVELRHKRGLYK